MTNEREQALRALRAELERAAPLDTRPADTPTPSGLHDYGLTAAMLRSVLQAAADHLQRERGRPLKKLTAATVLKLLQPGLALTAIAGRLVSALNAAPRSSPRSTSGDDVLAMRPPRPWDSEYTFAQDSLDGLELPSVEHYSLVTSLWQTGVPKRRVVEAITRRVLFATDRKMTSNTRLGVTYSGARDTRLTFGECVVSVPKDRLIGTLPLPRLTRLEFKAVKGRHFVLASIEPLTKGRFFARAAAQALAAASDDLFVFIHGYNTDFDEAVLRTAQLAVDLRLQGPAVLYSWPARGKTFDYSKDENSVTATADRFREFLSDLATQSGAGRINILAHSMGSRALCDALKVLGHAGRAPSETKIANVVFAAPDVDAEAYRNMAQAMVKPAGGVTLYASSRDNALRLSRLNSGAPRAGEPLIIAPGLDSVDASDVNTDWLQHGYFAEAGAMLHDLYDLFHGVPAKARFRLEPRAHADGPYFHFRA